MGYWSDETDWPIVVTGDHDAFGRIFDRHSDLVYMFVRRRTYDDALAEDVVSQVFLEAWRQRDRVVLHEGSLRSWLLAVARNLIIRHWRGAERAAGATDRIRVDRELTAGMPDISDGIEAAERMAVVRSVLEAMPETQREVLLLSTWEELSYGEIAAVLGVPVGTVRSRLSRAREYMRQHDRDGTHSLQRESLVWLSDRSTGESAELPAERNQL